MPDIPTPILEYIWTDMLAGNSPAYFLTDDTGRVLVSGGMLGKYGITQPPRGENISDILIFMEGLLPLEEPSLHLPLITTSPGIHMDAHVFRAPPGYGVVLMDATLEKDLLAGYQQKANELSLVREKQACEIEILKMNEIDFKHFFNAVNLAALELTRDGAFALLGEVPSWMHRFWPDLCRDATGLSPEKTFGFLEHFLAEAHSFWDQNKVGAVKSGIWIETDDEENEYLFEATAVTTRNKKMLIIAHDQCAFKEKQVLIQKGRDLALNYHTLERLEKELEQARDDLERRVRERTAELEQANAQLARELTERKRIEKERAEMMVQLQRSQKMEAIGTLAGGIAHDFNNILSAVIGYTELSLIEADQKTTTHGNLKRVLNAAMRAKELVRQILTFSHQAKEPNKPVNLKRIIEEGLSLIRASLPSTIEIRHELKSSEYVFADPTQMHQVIMNLCTNAGHAMQHSGGMLFIRLQDVEIDEETAKHYPGLAPGAYIRLSVEDTGHGMPPDVEHRIFDPFFTTKERGEGTGMGLSVVHGIIQGCNGKITVESTPGIGTKFLIHLPAFNEAVLAQSRPEQPLARGGERILFVDDEPFQAELAIHRLGKLGYEVVALTDSVEALNLFASNPNNFDLVITDLTMPKMTGKLLARELLKVRPEIPIILCSGYSESISEKKATEIGVKAYLMKPIVIGEMAKTIRKILDTPA